MAGDWILLYKIASGVRNVRNYIRFVLWPSRQVNLPTQVSAARNRGASANGAGSGISTKIWCFRKIGGVTRWSTFNCLSVSVPAWISRISNRDQSWSAPILCRSKIRGLVSLPLRWEPRRLSMSSIWSMTLYRELVDMKWPACVASIILNTTGAWAACNPSNAPLGSFGCQPVATSMAAADTIAIWQPSLYPASANQIAPGNLRVTGNATTATLATWASYLAGSPNPNTVIYGGASGTGTVTVSPFATGVVATSSAAAQLTNLLSSNASGGTANQVVALEINGVTIYGAPNFNWWPGLDKVTYSGTGGTGQHVARYAQTTRYGYGASGASNNPQLWAMVSENDDFTNQKSSLTNATIAHEFDISGTKQDDANNRTALSAVALVATGGAGYYEASAGYNLNVRSGAYLKTMYGAGGYYTNAALSFRYAAGFNKGATSVSTLTFPTVTAPVSASTTIPVSNVMPFTSDPYGRDIVANTATNIIKFSDGQQATMTGYTISGTGPTPTGTLTVSSPITLASGVTVYNNSNTIWLATGQTIALDTLGVAQLSSDATNAVLNVGLKLGPTGFYVNGNQFAIDGAGLVFAPTLPIREPGYALASLPAVTASNMGTQVWCNNCVNLAQSSSGTGVMVTMTSDGTYRTPWGSVASTSSPVLNALSYQINGTAGVSCPANTIAIATFVVNNGIVTHC